MKTAGLLVILFSFEFFIFNIQAQNYNVSLIKDINVLPESPPDQNGNMTNFILIDTQFFYLKSNFEIWRSDGTKNGTYQITDTALQNQTGYIHDFFRLGDHIVFFKYIPSGPKKIYSLNTKNHKIVFLKDIYNNQTTIKPLGVNNENLFFFNEDFEIWKTNGTPEGTVLVKSLPKDLPIEILINSIVYKNNFYFLLGDRSDNTIALWKSDPRLNTTVKVKNLYNGELNASVDFIVPMQITRDTLYFFVQSSFFGQKMWMSLGTDTTTKTIIGPEFQSIDKNQFIEFNSEFYFVADDGKSGKEIWKLKRNNTIENLKDIYPGPNGSFIQNLTIFINKLYFSAFNEFTGEELWSSDGTNANTSLVSDILPGNIGSRPRNFILLNDKLFFIANGIQQAANVYYTDGSPNGTKLVKSVIGNGQFSTTILHTALKNKLLFSCYEPQLGQELWTTDGTELNTSLVKDINPDKTYEYFGFQKYLFNLNDEIVFIGNDEEHGFELWKTDGTNSGTVLILDQFKNTESSVPRFIGQNTKGVLFTAYSNGSQQLWKTDGTKQGTIKLENKEVNVSMRNSATLNDIIYFAGYTVGPFTEIWRSDLTAPGTYLLKDINPEGNSLPEEFTAVGDQLFFTAEDAQNGKQLWKTKGTSESTQLVKVLNKDGLNIPTPYGLTKVNNALFFIGYDKGGYHIYRSDGSESGTFIVKRLPENFRGQIIEFQNNLFFAAESAIWITDGKTNVTTKLLDLPVGSGDIKQATIFKNSLYFVINDNVHGEEIWVSDGKKEGTKLFYDVYTGEIGSNPVYLQSNNKNLYFIAQDQNKLNEYKLYCSDGTIPFILKAPSVAQFIYSKPIGHLNNEFYFAYDSLGNGSRMWKTNGTAQGTIQVSDLDISTQNADADKVEIYNNELIFRANDYLVGHELYKIGGCDTAINTTPKVIDADCNEKLILNKYNLNNYTSKWKLLVKDSVSNLSDFEDVSIFKGKAGKDYLITVETSNPFCPAHLDTITINLKKNKSGALCTDFISGISDFTDYITGVSVYPNPSIGDFTLSFSLQKPNTLYFIVYDLHGKIVYANKKNSFNQGNHSITLNGTKMQEGLYLLSIQSTHFNIMKKLIVKK